LSTDASQPTQHTEFVASLLRRVGAGQLTVEQAVEQLSSRVEPVTVPTADANVDLDRRRRCGYPEVIYGPGKSTQAIVDIMRALVDRSEPGLATRVSPEQAQALVSQFSSAVYNAVARTVRLSGQPQRTQGKVVVVTAGTGDRPVAEEAVETLRWMNCEVELIVDIGVAGPMRLLEQKHRFESADALVVIAGMEGALPSVVGGWVSCPVVAVPTSIGYGASFGGIAALLGMLNSCAANVCVVNIDAGFKGAYIAGLIARQSHRCDDEVS
jgi:pyridinium-3,5-biscarboxylic acid mononucleotide synthase